VPDDSPLLFCPFCRECFEGETTCPDHELRLVPFAELPSPRREVPREEAVLPVHDLRFGRAFLLVAAVLVFAGFALPMVTTIVDEPSTATGFDVAMRVAPNLFAVPAVAAAFLSIFYRRRSLKSLRGARLAVPILALLGVTSLGWTLSSIYRGAGQQSAAWGIEVSVTPEIGVWLMGAGLLVALVAAFRLGAVPPSRELPHGSGPSGDDGVVVGDDDDD
jgi:hypothetical protein